MNFSDAKPADKFADRLDKNKEPRFLEQVKYYMERAAKSTDVPAEYLKAISECNATLRLNFPVVRDNGTIETITAYR